MFQFPPVHVFDNFSKKERFEEKSVNQRSENGKTRLNSGLNDQFYQKLTKNDHFRTPRATKILFFGLTGPVMSKPQVQSKSI